MNWLSKFAERVAVRKEEDNLKRVLARALESLNEAYQALITVEGGISKIPGIGVKTIPLLHSSYNSFANAIRRVIREMERKGKPLKAEEKKVDVGGREEVTVVKTKEAGLNPGDITYYLGRFTQSKAGDRLRSGASPYDVAVAVGEFLEEENEILSEDEIGQIVDAYLEEYSSEKGKVTLAQAAKEDAWDKMSKSEKTKMLDETYGKGNWPPNASTLSVSELKDWRLDGGHIDLWEKVQKKVKVTKGKGKTAQRVCDHDFTYKGVRVDATKTMSGYCRWEAEIELPNGEIMYIGDREGGEIACAEIKSVIDRALKDPEGFKSRERRWLLGTEKGKVKTDSTEKKGQAYETDWDKMDAESREKLLIDAFGRGGFDPQSLNWDANELKRQGIWEEVRASMKKWFYSDRSKVKTAQRGIDQMREYLIEIGYDAQKVLTMSVEDVKRAYEIEIRKRMGKKTGQRGIGEPPMGEGGTDICICPKCGYEVEHERGTPCVESTCPECGSPLVGKTAPIRKEVTPEEELEMIESLPSVLQSLRKGKRLSSKLTIDEIAQICPSCAEKLRERKIKSVDVSALAQAMLEEEQKDKSGITYTFSEKNRGKWESYWEAITGGENTFESCMDRLTGSSWIDEPTDFCTDLQKFVEGAVKGKTGTLSPKDVEYWVAEFLGSSYERGMYSGSDASIAEQIEFMLEEKGEPSLKEDEIMQIVREYKTYSLKGKEHYGAVKGKTKKVAISDMEAKRIIQDFIGESGVSKSYPERMFSENLSSYLDKEGIQVSLEDFEKLMNAAGQAGLIAALKIPLKVVAKICPSCAKEMEKKGKKFLLVKKGQLPKGWTTDSVKSFWKSIGGSFTKCVDALEGKPEITDANAMCAFFHQMAEGKWPAESSEKRKVKLSSKQGMERQGIVVKEKGKWYVKSKDGKKNLGGPYNTKEEAVKRLQQVEYFKHKG